MERGGPEMKAKPDNARQAKFREIVLTSIYEDVALWRSQPRRHDALTDFERSRAEYWVQVFYCAVLETTGKAPTEEAFAEVWACYHEMFPGFEKTMGFGELLYCRDCGIDTRTIGEAAELLRFSMKRLDQGGEDDRILCVGCLEQRIGRRLTKRDLELCPDYPGKPLPDCASNRLRERWGDQWSAA
jgi:hypothetical protein